MSAEYPHLFSPLAVGGHQVRNRTALTATLTNYGRASRVTDRWKDFLVERALGGTGLLVSEIIAVDPEALAHQAVVSGFDASNEHDFADTASRVQAAGAVLVGQLWHPGRQQLWQPSRSPMGISAQPDAYSWTVPHVMDDEDLERLVEAFVSVAERLAKCGFHGVELHGAHGYLLTQLLSPWSNTREGPFGGSREGRAKFCVDVARGIRERCPDGFIVGLKMPAREGVEGGIDAEEAALLTAHLAATGDFDYFAYGQGNFSVSLEDHVPDLHYRPAHFVDLHARMREAAAGVPVMALGRIGTPDLAEQVLSEGSADLIGMSRALVADASWAYKAACGKTGAIRPSVYNNVCWGEVHAGKPLEEFHNPELAQPGEHVWRPAPAETSRRVAVVGAGPAGLQCAWTAAARGHEVHLFGTSLKVGGKLRLEAALPDFGEMHHVVEYQLSRAREFDVHFHLGQAADAEALAGFDAVVLATGSRCEPPAVTTDGSVGMCSVHELAERFEAGDVPSGARALVFDHDHGAMVYGAVDALAARFDEVVLATPRTHLAQNVNYCSALGVHRRLHGAGVIQRVASEPVSISNGSVGLRNLFTREVAPVAAVDLLVYATPRRVNDALAAQLSGDVHLVGDAQSPRNLMMAVHHGHLAAMAL